LADLIAAQLEFHKKAYEILSELAPTVDALQVEQEVSSYLADHTPSISNVYSRPATARAVKVRKLSSSVFLFCSNSLPNPLSPG
jgi:hypothetical protein